MTGAALGSVIPGIGTVAGAIGGGVLGGLAGLWGGDGGQSDQNARLAAYDRELRNRQAPQVNGQFNAGPSQYEQNRGSMLAYLNAQARGLGPSVAANQMRMASDRAVGSQGALAAGAAGRGMSAGAAFRGAANNTAAIQQQGAQDAANARIQEMTNAQGLYANAMGQAVGQTNQASQFNAQQNQQIALANLDAQLRAQGMNDAQRMAILQQYGQQVGPGLGSQILAGGASAMPLLMAQMQKPATPDPNPNPRQYGGNTQLGPTGALNGSNQNFGVNLNP
jgi:hypothetical protein